MFQFLEFFVVATKIATLNSPKKPFAGQKVGFQDSLYV